MSGLKSLAICCLAAASVFAMAETRLAHRADIQMLPSRLGQGIAALVGAPADHFGAPVYLDLLPPAPENAHDFAHAVPQGSVAQAAPPADGGLTPAQRIAVTARLEENLSPEMRKNFSLFLYVSKASSGPLAQRLYIFSKNRDGGLELVHDWAASTGREQDEVTPHGRHAFTATPRGYYELDPARMYPQYQSQAWDQPMPYAMFFNWERHGEQTGLAIHSASGGDIEKLNSRASAGCVHLSPEHAQALYNLIRDNYRGPAPRLAYDREGEMNNRGEFQYDQDGRLKMADGYQVLIFIEDFGGRNKLAALD